MSSPWQVHLRNFPITFSHQQSSPCFRSICTDEKSLDSRIALILLQSKLFTLQRPHTEWYIYISPVGATHFQSGRNMLSTFSLCVVVQGPCWATPTSSLHPIVGICMCMYACYPLSNCSRLRSCVFPFLYAIGIWAEIWCVYGPLHHGILSTWTKHHTNKRSPYIIYFLYLN